MRMAFVDREAYRPDNEMFGLVARNRDFNLRHFDSLEDALAWQRA